MSESNVVEFPDRGPLPATETPSYDIDLGIRIPIDTLAVDYLFFLGAKREGLVDFVTIPTEEHKPEEITHVKVAAQSRDMKKRLLDAKALFDKTDFIQLLRAAFAGDVREVTQYINNYGTDKRRNKTPEDRLDKEYRALILPTRLLATATQIASKRTGSNVTVLQKGRELQNQPYTSEELNLLAVRFFRPALRDVQTLANPAPSLPAKW